jgi:hypothetical protein
LGASHHVAVGICRAHLEAGEKYADGAEWKRENWVPGRISAFRERLKAACLQAGVEY